MWHDYKNNNDRECFLEMSDQSLFEADEGVEGDRGNTADAPRVLQDDYRKALGLKIQRDFLSPEREKELWARREDPAAKAELLESYHPLCQALAMDAFKKSRAGKVSFEDFEAEALLTLVDCYDRYDPEDESKARFGSFAMSWIKRAVMDLSIRMGGPVKMATTKEERSLFYNWGACNQQALQENPQATRHARQKRITELMAERTRYKDIAVDTIDRYEGRAQSRDLSLSTPLKTGTDSISLQDFIAADYGAADERLIERDRQRNAAMMQAALTTLDERARTILTRRLMCEDGEESALQDLGNQFGISAERVRQIEGKALKQLRTFMGVEEPQAPKKRLRVSRAKTHSPA